MIPTDLVSDRPNVQRIATKLGKKVGDEVEVIGKFKRPSAQKTDNLRHDLTLLSKMVGVLKEDGINSKLPAGFKDQVGSAVMDEMDFAGEAEFAQKLVKDIEARGRYKDYSVEVPTIIYSTDDLVLETVAPGMSLRTLLDYQSQGPIVDEAFLTPLSKVKGIIAREALGQILKTGNFHADLHPANIFVDMVNQKVTLIDLGMHGEVDQQTTRQIRDLVVGLTLGSKRIVSNSLHELGWKIETKTIDLI